MGIFESYKKRHAFTAENCRRKQDKMVRDRYERKIEDISARINYVIENSNDEHAVIYCVRNHDREMYDRISDYFSERGFKTIITVIPTLDNEYIIISW